MLKLVIEEKVDNMLEVHGGNHRAIIPPASQDLSHVVTGRRKNIHKESDRLRGTTRADYSLGVSKWTTISISIAKAGNPRNS